MGKETTSTTIRTMTAADIKAARLIDEDAFHDPWSDNMWVDEINNSLSTYLVLEENGIMLGYAGFWLVVGEAQVTRVAIAKTERNRGLGKVLTKAMLESAWEQGATAMTLEVRESNISAQKIYQANGFVSEGVRPNYYEDNHENAVIMWIYKN